jgi:carboxypeptidase Q
MEEKLLFLREVCKNEMPSIYKSLETLCLYFPGRVTGSKTLEKAISHLYEDTRKNLPDSCCKKEEVKDVTRWVRYGNFGEMCYESSNSDPTLKDLTNRKEEQCFIEIIPSVDAEGTGDALPYPLTRQVRIIANGLSVGTGPDGIKGQLVVIKSWEELEKEGSANHLTGKIILYDFINFTSYGELSLFRYLGALRAEKYGAIGVLVRTLTPNTSLSGPHTGVQCGDASIPSVCIAIEDCEMIRRLIERGFGIETTMILPCCQLPKTVSHNLLFEIPGSEKPEELILIGGHVDSWDCQYGCCQGAHDDGQAIILAIEIIKLFTKYGLKPKRTIRAVIFTDEEVTQTGANSYQENHIFEAKNVQVAIESDCGVGPVLGYNFKGNPSFFSKIHQLLYPISTTFDLPTLQYKESYVGVDIEPMCEKDNIPGLLLKHTDDWWKESYFHYHHSPSDSIDHINKDLLQDNFLILLTTVWLLANSEESLRE